MRIEYRRDNEIKIEEVKPGECFLYDGRVKMKLHVGPFESLKQDNYPNIFVDLESGRLDGMGNGISMVQVKTAAIIYNSWEG